MYLLYGHSLLLLKMWFPQEIINLIIRQISFDNFLKTRIQFGKKFKFIQTRKYISDNLELRPFLADNSRVYYINDHKSFMLTLQENGEIDFHYFRQSILIGMINCRRGNKWIFKCFSRKNPKAYWYEKIKDTSFKPQNIEVQDFFQMCENTDGIVREPQNFQDNYPTLW